MNRVYVLFAVASLGIFGAGCSKQEPAAKAPEVSRGGYRIYATNEGSGDMTVIDSATHEVVATVALGKRPRGIHASPDGKTIYVALSGSPFAPPGTDESKLPPPDRSADGIGVVDVAQNKLVKVLTSGPDPEQFDLSKDGSLLYVSNEDASMASIVDVTAGKVTKTVKVGEEPEGVTTSPDGKFVYVTSEEDAAVFVVDTAKNEVIKNFKTGHRPRSVAFLPNGTKAYVTCEVDNLITVVDAVKHAPIKNIPLGDKQIRPMGAVVSADGTKAYFTTGRGGKVAVLDTATDQITSMFDVGERPWGIALSPDGKTMYTANGPSMDVSVIDVATLQVKKKVKAGDRPWGVITVSMP